MSFAFKHVSLLSLVMLVAITESSCDDKKEAKQKSGGKNADAGITSNTGEGTSGNGEDEEDDGPTNITDNPTETPDAPVVLNSVLRDFESNLFVTGTGAGAASHVRVFDSKTSGDAGSVFAYDPSALIGARVAVGDVNGDKQADFISIPGPGGAPHVRIFSRGGGDLGSFFAYDASLTTGFYVAAGDVDGDGKADIITGPGTGGGPHVKIFHLDGTEMRSFFAFDQNLRTGIHVAAGDVDGDGRADVVVGAGEGGAPHVKTFTGNGFAEIGNFFAYDSNLRSGVRVATTDFNGDDKADLVTAPGPGGGPHVRIVSHTGGSLHDFFPYDPSLTVGVYVGGIPRR